MARERTEAQRRSEARYKDKNCDRLAVMLPKGHKVLYQEAARRVDLSWRQFVIASMDFYIAHKLPDMNFEKMKSEVEKQKESLENEK